MTYTLVTAISDGVALLIGSPRDGDTAGIDSAIAGHREMERENETDEAEIELIPGCILTDEAPDDEDRIMWRGHEMGYLIDENSQTYKYAVKEG